MRALICCLALAAAPAWADDWETLDEDDTDGSHHSIGNNPNHYTATPPGGIWSGAFDQTSGCSIRLKRLELVDCPSLSAQARPSCWAISCRR